MNTSKFSENKNFDSDQESDFRKISGIIENKKNDLLQRREIKAIVEAGKNPSFSEALDLIVENFKANKEFVVIKAIKGKFGRNTFLVNAFIYESKEAKESIERKQEKKTAGETGQEEAKK